MKILAQQVGPGPTIRQMGLGPIVTLAMGPESAPAVLAASPFTDGVLETDRVLVERNGALTRIAAPSFAGGGPLLAQFQAASASDQVAFVNALLSALPLVSDGVPENGWWNDNGVPTQVRSLAALFGLEDGLGALLLEDTLGPLALEAGAGSGSIAALFGLEDGQGALLREDAMGNLALELT